LTLRVDALFSGGKDSTYAIWIAQHQGWDVACLITVNSDKPDSRVFHTPNVSWTRLQADAMGLPHTVVDSGGYDELGALRESLSGMKSREGISGIVTGAVASDYQKTRFDNMCETIGLKTYAPLWHKSPGILLEDLKKSGFRIILTAVAAKGLDDTWLGKELTAQEWSRLENLSRIHGIHLTGEGGEYESFVLDAPFFKKEIRIEDSRVEWHEDAGRLVIERASLRDKLGH
jgi:diphthine-ammonia ligase